MPQNSGTDFTLHMFSKRGCECPSGQILIERDIDGKLLPTAKCVECTDGAQPSKDKTICQPCLYSPILKVESLIWLRGNKLAYLQTWDLCKKSPDIL